VRVGVLQIPGAKDPDEYIKKYGAERFQALLDGVGNALDFKLGQLRGKYDLKQDAQRLEYIKEAVLLLADRTSPTEQDLYAGRLAEETNISKTAILAQLNDAMRKGAARRRREQQKAILHSGEMDTIRVPYQAGGQNALGQASAEQRLIVASAARAELYPARAGPAETGADRDARPARGVRGGVPLPRRGRARVDGAAGNAP